MKVLRTTDEVIDTLGGNRAVASLLGYTDTRAVWNWRSAYRGKFPAETFRALNIELESLGVAAPPSLWSQIERHAEAAE